MTYFLKFTWWATKKSAVDLENLNDQCNQSSDQLNKAYCKGSSSTFRVFVEYDESQQKLFVLNKDITKGLEYPLHSIQSATMKDKDGQCERLLIKIKHLDEQFSVLNIVNKRHEPSTTLVSVYDQIIRQISGLNGPIKGRARVNPTHFYGDDPETKNKAPAKIPLASLQVFYRQAAAFEMLDSLSTIEKRIKGEGWPAPMCLSFEEARSGKRKFMVAGKESLMRHVFQLRPLQRHFYEIIRENCPCRLYLDLEFNKDANPLTNGDELVEKVVSYIAYELVRVFRIRISRNDVLQLNSSSDTKFSQHLIFHGTCLFANNRECGLFVKYVASRYQDLFAVWDKSKHNKTSFLDLGVYSKNRMFRLIWSCKFGKTAILEPDKNCKFPWNEETENDLRSLFEASIVCPHVYDKNSIVDVNDGLQLFDSFKSLTANFQHRKRAKLIQRADSKIGSIHQSAFPFLERYLVNYILKHSRCMSNINTKIRSHFYRIEGNQVLLIYNIAGNRFCFNIMRQHKSNHIYYVVNLTTLKAYQACHDPDCAGFRSAAIDIRRNLLPNEFNLEAIKTSLQQSESS